MADSRPPALRIDTDGTVTILPDWAYQTIRAGVGGLIEAVPSDDRITVWVNEEGKINGLPFNPIGHALWALMDCYGCITAGDWMAGPCVVTGPADDDGENTAVPEWVLPRLAGLGAPIPGHPRRPSTIEHVLDVLDVGLQNAPCAPPDTDHPGPGWCVRCRCRLPIETGGDLCKDCRAFLTDPTDATSHEAHRAGTDR